MTEKIQLLLEGVRNKSNELHKLLVDERSKNEQLNTELQQLKQEKSDLEAKNEELVSNNNRLISELNSTKVQGIGTEVAIHANRNEEIDELVKEIEYCITQLKK